MLLVLKMDLLNGLLLLILLNLVLQLNKILLLKDQILILVQFLSIKISM